MFVPGFFCSWMCFEHDANFWKDGLLDFLCRLLKSAVALVFETKYTATTQAPYLIRALDTKGATQLCSKSVIYVKHG